MNRPRRPRFNSYAWTSSYRGFWAQHYYGMHFSSFFDSRITSELDLRERLVACEDVPEIFMMGNFVQERAGILSLCREYGINTVHGEDGFFPHYRNAHCDPLGFCWESSLPRIVFRDCTDAQHRAAVAARAKWVEGGCGRVPNGIRPPYVLWPLQLIGDKVNQFDLAVRNWTELLRHFRACLPTCYQLVIKEHPRAKSQDGAGIPELVAELPNSLLLPPSSDVRALIVGCSAVAGANSSVLYEARLMCHKPAYAYARSWFTNHEELFMPLSTRVDKSLPRIDWIDDGRRIRSERLDAYADWFLAQLLGRQVNCDRAKRDATWLKDRIYQLSYDAYVQYGEEVFMLLDSDLP